MGRRLSVFFAGRQAGDDGFSEKGFSFDRTASHAGDRADFRDRVAQGSRAWTIAPILWRHARLSEAERRLTVSVRAGVAIMATTAGAGRTPHSDDRGRVADIRWLLADPRRIAWRANEPDSAALVEVTGFAGFGPRNTGVALVAAEKTGAALLHACLVRAYTGLTRGARVAALTFWPILGVVLETGQSRRAFVDRSAVGAWLAEGNAHRLFAPGAAKGDGGALEGVAGAALGPCLARSGTAFAPRIAQAIGAFGWPIVVRIADAACDDETANRRLTCVAERVPLSRLRTAVRGGGVEVETARYGGPIEGRASGGNGVLHRRGSDRGGGDDIRDAIRLGGWNEFAAADFHPTFGLREGEEIV